MRINSEKMTSRAAAVIVLILAAMAGAEDPSPPNLPSKVAEKDVTYGHDPNLVLPKTALFSATADEIAADAEEWAKHGFNAFFLDNIAGEWSSDIWGADGKPWTIGESDENFQKARKANEVCKKIGSETFLKIHYAHFLEWFNDTAWQRINNNFRQFAIFARDTGCVGLALDIEYNGDQYAYEWPGYDYKGYTRKDLAAKVRERMTGVMAAMLDEFPNMVFLSLPEEGFNLGGIVHEAWIEEMARRNAPGGFHYCTEGTYRNSNLRHMLGHAWACNELFQKVLSKRGQKYWVAKCSIAEGLWPYGFDYQQIYDPGLTLDEYRQAIAASLMVSRRYNWVFAHIAKDQFIGRAAAKYHGTADIPAYLKAQTDREIITTPKFAALARDLRDMKLRDYSKDLGLIPTLGFNGPLETPYLRLVPLESVHPDEIKTGWDLALKYYRGEEIDLRKHFQTQTQWMLLGPFPSDDRRGGHNVAYPPEQNLGAIDLKAECDGVNGKIRWIEHKAPGTMACIDLTTVFKPNEKVCAYALCYVTSPSERKVQLRVGTNDAGKVWLGKDLVLDYPYEGMAELDRDIIPVTLPKGTTPILLKITNGIHNWGFIFRITDPDGRPAQGLQFGVHF